jgi:type VI secretion system protein VasI
MRLLTIIALLASVLLTPARAQDDPKNCAEISNDAERLECFDLIFKKSSTTTIAPKSDWIVTQENSKIDDSANVSLTVSSMQPITNQYGMQTNLDMYIVCREKKTDFYIVFGDQFMSSIEEYGKVTFRLDKRPAFQKQMTESTDHKALGLWGGAVAIPFTKGLFGGSDLFVRAIPYNESAVSADFNVSGLQSAISPLERACNWSTAGGQ